MGKRKYVSDYAIEDYQDEKGKLRSRRVYQGKHYRFIKPTREIIRLRYTIIIVCVLVAALLLSVLLADTALGRTAYIVLPAVLSFAPVYLLLAAAIRLDPKLEQFTREHRDKTEKRIRAAVPVLLTFLTVACIGCVAEYFRGNLPQGELPYVICLVTALMASASLLPLRKYADCYQTEETH